MVLCFIADKVFYKAISTLLVSSHFVHVVSVWEGGGGSNSVYFCLDYRFGNTTFLSVFKFSTLLCHRLY